MLRFISLILIFTFSAFSSSVLANPRNQKIQTVTHFELTENQYRKMTTPLVINTWGFSEATRVAWETLANGGSALDAVEMGCSKCEELQCGMTVGFGGSPDENGETTLDAMIMDGESHDMGAVACLRRVKPAISVARKVMEHTKHSILAGDLATEFALQMGFKEEDLTTPESRIMHLEWKNNSCQPNYWKTVHPDPSLSCGPYKPIPQENIINEFNHDTIGMIVIDQDGKIASGTSSNGARNKIPGRVGDAPIPGAGSYVDKDVGGAAATGDGDVMMRFLPSLITVENMRLGLTPSQAAEAAIRRITKFYPKFSGAIVASTISGEYGAACHGLPEGFPFSVINPQMESVHIGTIYCTSHKS